MLHRDYLPRALRRLLELDRSVLNEDGRWGAIKLQGFVPPLLSTGAQKGEGNQRHNPDVFSWNSCSSTSPPFKNFVGVAHLAKVDHVEKLHGSREELARKAS